jgi:hypothetical protein
MAMTRRRDRQTAILEARLTGPKRITLFGHCNVGKTTLLAILYREASNGRIPGIRMAAGDARTAEYLAEQIARIESGEPTASSRTETDLKLTLYHGPARIELFVRDYQGEHVRLGMEEPIQEFFAACDAVFLCLDPEGSTGPAERRCRQQEVENLLERYILTSDDLGLGRPVALVLTRFDRVLAGLIGRDGAPDIEAGLSAAFVEKLVDERYGMTQHALAEHAPQSAIFAVSSFGTGASGNRPPEVLCPLGLAGPLSWLAEEIEARDRADMQRLSETAASDLPCFKRCVAAYDRRYPRSNRSHEFRDRLRALKRQRRRRWALRLVACGLMALAGLAAFDFVDFQRTSAFEQSSASAPPAVARRWSQLRQWHPSLPLFWPALARRAQLKEAEWLVRAADVLVAEGWPPGDLAARIERLEAQTPGYYQAAIRSLNQAREQARHDTRWQAVRAEVASLSASDDPARPLAVIDGFLREFPATPRRGEALVMAGPLKIELTAKRSSQDRRFIDELIRSDALPNVSLNDQIERVRKFLTEHPDSPVRDEAEGRLEDYLRRVDMQDIERARAYSREYPANFEARIERYQNYLKAHQAGWLFISEAMEAKDQILREWDVAAYRQAFDHALAHPDDLAEVARRLRNYLRDHPDGRHVGDAERYLDWWDKVSVPSPYRVTLRRGEVEPAVGKYLAGGAPDLGVVIEVAGKTYGPSSVVRNSHTPIWEYTFPEPVTWKLNDPITIRVIDYDWSATAVYVLHSRQDDPLAIRLLSGTIKPAKGGRTTLVFASDFIMPTLSRPE